ncbi:UDP-N-acetylmuramoyl-L-alanine--D-glutamate ligase [Rickettsia endosymbiont of Polydrusus tereticollis]|uniref:UDP-N-acetylmuramoyl-L-alanine--D-glutamate ligase n=1 Tax=Rickettsia endosymbiont of Polydrusus tereticollis TaxID=3066251 RepID=UPI003132E818
MVTSSQKQNIGIFGLGKTGLSVYEVLKEEAQIIVYDDSKDNRDIFAGLYGEEYLTNLASSKWQSCDKIILSPGIPLDHEIVRLASRYNIPIISDIDLLFENSKNSNFIAVTGTNGKSTSTALISHILNLNGFDYPAVGNIGLPALKAGTARAGYVLELSSFQLDLIKIFKANIAILLNITPDHLDRHKNMDSYIAAKCKIFDRMAKGDYAIINIDNDYCREIFLSLKQEKNINVIAFSVSEILNKGISIVKDKIYDKFFADVSFTLPFNKNLQGLHNYENIAASYAAARAMSLEPSQILASIKQFQGLPHRMQYIGSVGRVGFYNDSKATNAEAASKSIKALDNIYWLAGGIAKEGGIEEIKPLFDKIKKAYLFGQAKEIFARTLKGKVDFEICENLEQAFNNAYEDASKDKEGVKNILLAPSCSSYDQFKDFEQRGELFIKLCQEKIG